MCLRDKVARLEVATMLWTIVGILLLLWLVGFVGGFGGSLIHVLLVLAIVVFAYDLITRRRHVV